MKNRDQVIRYIERLAASDQCDTTTEDVQAFIDQVNTRSSRWGSNRKKWFFIVLAMTPVFLLLYSQGPSRTPRTVMPWWIVYAAIVGSFVLL
ncbi:MAG: hypothetical protein ACF8LL_03035, partial [Phycisphaerales bacterium]